MSKKTWLVAAIITGIIIVGGVVAYAGTGKCLSCGCMGFSDASCGGGVCRCGHGYSLHI